MVLNAEHRKLLVSHPLNRLIVQIDMGHFQAVFHCIRVKGVPVVLRRDVDASGGEFFDRMVPAAVPEL